MFPVETTALSLISFLIHQPWYREFWEIKAQPHGARPDLENGSPGGGWRTQVTAVLSCAFPLPAFPAPQALLRLARLSLLA